ncbi:MAG: Mut7-C ubiquitin/RNAse domain-containing protein, partial [Chloroflexi bacterium]|nr:Mut7-C ubiquitin/RNAse domain-containing protein [Chloroflexota bacterium]
MPQAHFRFYAELNDFLPPRRRQIAFVHSFAERASVKDVIEALGAPHTEVEAILVNGAAVGFGYLVQDGDWISVYPAFASLPLPQTMRLRPPLPAEARFVLDAHLGRLTAYLRMLGFDALYRNDFADEELARLAQEDGRILLTRDRGLLKRSVVTHGYCIRSTQAVAQAAEVLRRFDLGAGVQPFHRCLRCNGTLQPVERSAVLGQLPPR